MMMVKRAKNIKFDELNSRREKKFGFQNLKKRKPFLTIEVSLKISLNSENHRKNNSNEVLKNRFLRLYMMNNL